MKRHIVPILTAAAVLLTGCTQKTQQITQETTEVTWENGTVLHLTEQADIPSMHGLAQTDSGMFFIGEQSGDKLTGYGKALRYYDSESGETVYLCARPNCLHDGNEFCTATTSNYELVSAPVWLDGYVYAAAVDHSAQLSQSNLKYRTVLLRYAADGTEITKVADLHADEQSETDWYYFSDVYLMAHRGQLWMKCSYQRTVDASDPSLDIIETERFGGYDIFTYAPADGKLTRIIGTDSLIKDYDESSFRENFSGSGDYVYFIKTSSEWQDPVKGQGIFRIDCNTGAIEQVIKPKNGMHIRYYAVSGDQLVYDEYSDVREDYALYKTYDLTTGETKELITMRALGETLYPDYQEPSYFRAGSLLCDAEHVFIFWTFTDADQNTDTDYLSVFGWDGTLQQTVPLKLPNITDTDFVEQMVERITENWKHKDKDTEKYIADLRKNGVSDHLYAYWENATYHYADGVFYFKGSYREYALSLADVLDGKSEMTPLYFYQTFS